MKYFDKMNELETQVIRLQDLRGLYNVIINGILNGSSHDDALAAICYIEGSLDDISDEMTKSYYELFEEMRADENNDGKKKAKK